jgi:hypothetical protein
MVPVEKKLKNQNPFPNYALYQTLNSDLPSTAPTKPQLVKLLGKLKKLTLDKRKAVMMLIYEHSRLENPDTFSPETQDLPYNGVQTKEGVEYDLANLPHPLVHILYKFLN